MTLYTPNRGYPFPASPREAGNGGLHSELLARAVARDLDALDAAWAAAAQPSTKVMNKNTDTTNLTANAGGSGFAIFMDVVEKQTGQAFTTETDELAVAAGWGGWFLVNCQLRSKAQGAITAGARHTLFLRVLGPGRTGNLTELETRRADTFANGATVDIYNQIQGMIRLEAGNRIWIGFDHTNTGSNVTVQGTGTGGTKIEATRICGL